MSVEKYLASLTGNRRECLKLWILFANKKVRAKATDQVVFKLPIVA